MAGSKRGPPPKPFEGQKGRCCWCGASPLPKGRRSWCSDACVGAYLAQTPGGIRSAVWERDRGVCQLCGRDCDGLRDRILARFKRGRDHANALVRVQTYRLAKLLGRLGVGCSARWWGLRTLWEADHIKPVCEGGGNELSNLRTACIPCHKRVTRELARRRAEARRPQQRLAL